MKKSILMFLLASNIVFISPAMAAEYCYQDDYIFRANTGDTITSGSMAPLKLANERIGFPYDAQLTQIRITPLNSKIQNNQQNKKAQQGAANDSNSFKNARIATIIPQPINVKAFQGVKVNLIRSQNSSCQPCTAKQVGVTTNNGVQSIDLELCSKLAINKIEADLVFTRN